MIILKIGGGIAINIQAIAEDLKKLQRRPGFEKIVVVHGANAIRDRIARDLNRPTKTITSPGGVSSVYTDAAAMEVFLMAYPGVANTTLVSCLQHTGIPAVGLTGVDGALLQARRKKALYALEGAKQKLITDSYTGRIVSVNTTLLTLLLDNGFVPVVSPPALSEDGEMVNVENDTVVTMLAQALHADTIISLFEAPGFLKDANTPSSVLPRLNENLLETYTSSAQGRMKRKVMSALDALKTGVTKIYWGDGRVQNPISSLLEGNGTIISASEL